MPSSMEQRQHPCGARLAFACSCRQLWERRQLMRLSGCHDGITRRKRDPLHPQLDAVAHLPTPVYALEVTFGMLAVECDPDLERLAAAYSGRQAAKAATLSAAQVCSFASVLRT